MATADEVFQALVKQDGFEIDNENWTENTYIGKYIVPGKVQLYFQTGTSEDSPGVPNFGLWLEGGIEDKNSQLYKNLKVELHNIVSGDLEEEDGFIYVLINNLDDRTVNWALKTIQELERRVLFEFSR